MLELFKLHTYLTCSSAVVLYFAVRSNSPPVWTEDCLLICVWLFLAQGQEAVGGGDSTSEVSVSCSSTDDTASVGHPSSSAESSEEVRHGEEAEEEAKDSLTEVPLPAALFHSTVCSLSPFRRHSWGPEKNQGGEEEMNQRRYLRSRFLWGPFLFSALWNLILSTLVKIYMIKYLENCVFKHHSSIYCTGFNL